MLLSGPARAALREAGPYLGRAFMRGPWDGTEGRGGKVTQLAGALNVVFSS